MATVWREEDEEFRAGGVMMKAKPRFSFHEIKVLLNAVTKNRYILLSESACVGRHRVRELSVHRVDPVIHGGGWRTAEFRTGNGFKSKDFTSFSF